MKSFTYTLVDVFTTVPFGGNQLAVFDDGSEIEPETMQTIARELNLSETVFICPPKNPKNQKSLRIFTPHMELPMAGHPTIGACCVLAAQKMAQLNEGENNWILEEVVGEIQVTIYKKDMQISKVEMFQPLPEFRNAFTDTELAADLLSLSPEELDERFPIQTVTTGVPFLFIPVRSLGSIKKIKFRNDVWEQHFKGRPDMEHIFAFTAETLHPDSTVHSRMFAPAMGISEDPATGAASGPLGAFLVEHGVVPPAENEIYNLKSEQGMEIGRPSFIDITIRKAGSEFKEIKIGGTSVIMGCGELFL